jgi:hypothetical protein
MKPWSHGRRVPVEQTHPWPVHGAGLGVAVGSTAVGAAVAVGAPGAVVGAGLVVCSAVAGQVLRNASVTPA